MASFKKNIPHYFYLKEKWTKKNKDLQEKLFINHRSSFEWLLNNSKRFAISTLAGFFIVTSPLVLKLVPTSAMAQNVKKIDKKVFLISDLLHVVPDEVRPLTDEEEKEISYLLSRDYGINVAASINGKKLNRSYGFIGAEQHLARFSGDSIETHFENEKEAENFWSSGMAPGLGAWGYFSDTSNLSKEDKLREKYYIAVQTFLAPGFNNNPKEYLDFFKYGKMLVVNPQNGKAVVAVIGDSGPAVWTGKQLGGSPEVMKELERVDGRQIGPVLYFFVDDLKNEVPLGPISL